MIGSVPPERMNVWLEAYCAIEAGFIRGHIGEPMARKQLATLGYSSDALDVEIIEFKKQREIQI